MSKALIFKLQFLLIMCVTASSFANDSSDTTVKTVVVTCATGELGGAISKQLARQYNLILTGRNFRKLTELQKELQAIREGQYDVILLDYSSEGSLVVFKKELESKKSVVSGLVLMTPRPNFGQNLLEAQSEWLRLFQTYFTGPIEAMKVALSSFGSHGKIVIIGGTTSVQLMPEYGPACMIRRMWTTYAKALSYQLGHKGVTVNVVSPGVVATRFHEERIQRKAESNGMTYEEQLKKEVMPIPLKRYPTPIEVAQSVAFMLSNQSDALTGVNLIIDGGATTSY